MSRPNAAERRLLSAYAETHLKCALCFLPSRRAYGIDRMLQIHHLAGRTRKGCHEHGNLLILCGRCHRQLHDGGCFGDDGERLPKLTPGMLLQCKREADGVDLGLIAALKGWKSLPDHWLPCELPAAYLAERARN